jgi:hypothetical protein
MDLRHWSTDLFVELQWPLPIGLIFSKQRIIPDGNDPVKEL